MEQRTIDIGEFRPAPRPLLPIIFVLDTSGSMLNASGCTGGQPISMLNRAMEEVVEILTDFSAHNADALLKIGVLQVHSGADWVQPRGLEELGDFIYSPLSAGGLTDFGEALNELNKKLSRSAFLVSTSGHCMPIIIFMTDGKPTDDWESALKTLETNGWYQNAVKIGFCVGENAERDFLIRIVGGEKFEEAVISTNDLEKFSNLLKKAAVESAMVVSHPPTSENPNGVDIAKNIIKESNDTADEGTPKEDDPPNLGAGGPDDFDPEGNTTTNDPDDDWP